MLSDPREETGGATEPREDIHGDLLRVDVGMQAADPDPATEVVGALIDHNNPRHVDHFQ